MTLHRDHVAGLALIALAIAALVMGRELPFGTAASPGPGMLPDLVAVVTIVLGAVLLAQAHASPAFATIAWDDLPHALVAIAAAGLAAVLYTTLGFPVTFGLLLLGLMYGVERMALGPTLAISAVVTGGTWLLLGSLLKTPMPTGILGF